MNKMPLAFLVAVIISIISCEFKPVEVPIWKHQAKIDEVLKFEKSLNADFEILEQYNTPQNQDQRLS